jgi:hypothetical protein
VTTLVSFSTACYSVNYAIHNYFNGSWQAWRMENSCFSEGKKIFDGDLYFTNGWRVFFEVNGRTMSSAQSTFKVDKVGASWMSVDFYFERFLGKELSLIFTLEAKAMGWI